MGSATPLTIWSSFRWWGGCAGGSTSCPGFPQTKSSILCRAQFVGVALFLIARGVPVHEFVASDHPAGLQRSYEHQLANCQLPIAKLYSCTIANSSNCKLPNCIIAQLSEDFDFGSPLKIKLPYKWWLEMVPFSPLGTKWHLTKLTQNRTQSKNLGWSLGTKWHLKKGSGWSPRLHSWELGTKSMVPFSPWGPNGT